MQPIFDLDRYKTPEMLTGIVLKGHAGKPAGQGPYIAIYLATNKDTIDDATFQTYGCPVCIACSQAVCEMVKNLRFSQAQEITQAHLKNKVGDLPKEKRHCLTLAMEALKDALQKTSITI